MTSAVDLPQLEAGTPGLANTGHTPPGCYLHRRVKNNPDEGNKVNMIYQNGVRQPYFSDNGFSQRQVALVHERKELRQPNTTPIPEMFYVTSAHRSKGELSTTGEQNKHLYRNPILDFSKLKKYNWEKSKKAPTLPAVAPDRFYRSTYGTRTEKATSFKVEPITLPLRGTRNKTGSEESGIDYNRHSQMMNRKGRKVRQPALSDRLKQATDRNEPFLNIQICGRQSKSEGHNLYSQVKTSIEKFDTKEHGDVIDRPLSRERGTYRPTRHYTSPRGTNLFAPCMNQEKDFKSADVFVELVNTKLESKQEHIKSRPSTCVSSHIVTGKVESELLQSVIDCNQPKKQLEESAVNHNE